MPARRAEDRRADPAVAAVLTRDPSQRLAGAADRPIRPGSGRPGTGPSPPGRRPSPATARPIAASFAEPGLGSGGPPRAGRRGADRAGRRRSIEGSSAPRPSSAAEGLRPDLGPRSSSGRVRSAPERRPGRPGGRAGAGRCRGACRSGCRAPAASSAVGRRVEPSGRARRAGLRDDAVDPPLVGPGADVEGRQPLRADPARMLDHEPVHVDDPERTVRPGPDLDRAEPGVGRGEELGRLLVLGAVAGEGDAVGRRGPRGGPGCAPARR